MRGATRTRRDGLRAVRIFQSTLLMRGATVKACPYRRIQKFQSTLLMRGATKAELARLFANIFQSTLLMRGATEAMECIKHKRVFQSTLLMRGATCRVLLNHDRKEYFNPRSSCEERLGRDSRRMRRTDFNPRSSCEERQARQGRAGCYRPISIHAPHARSDVH